MAAAFREQVSNAETADLLMHKRSSICINP
jgi:hypothetical protein